jgi:uncharacterized protein YjlB
MKDRINTNPHILSFVFKKNKNFPNSRLPVLIYQNAMELPGKKKSIVTVQKIFLRNGWSNSWSNGIYDFHHYHSNTHECMAVCTGEAEVILGGPKGKKVKLAKGDVIILPAGVGHKCLNHSEDFKCVGAYPQGKEYDTNLGKNKELEQALSNIKKLSMPSKDPVFGKEGFLKTYWKSNREKLKK